MLDALAEARTDAPSTAVAPATHTPVAKAVVSIKDAAIAHLRAKEPAILALAEKYRAVALPLSTPKELAAGKAIRLELRESGRFEIQRDRDATKDLLNGAKKDVEIEAERLIAIVKPVEDHVHAQIEAREAVIAAEKAERERIEAERVAGHRARITAIRECVAKARGISSERIAKGLAAVTALVVDEATYQEFAAEATTAKAETLSAMQALLDSAKAAEDAAAAAEAQRVEQARVAEAQRAEAERLETARQMIAKAEREAAEKIEADRKAFEAERTAWLAEQEAAKPKPAAAAEPEAPAPEVITRTFPDDEKFDGAEIVAQDEPEVVAVVDEPKDEPATLSAGNIAARLGFALPVDYITTTLGIPPALVRGRATLWTASQFRAICAALVVQINEVAEAA